MPLAGGEVVAGNLTDPGLVNARMELIGRVAAGLAHDLNGPIGVMLGFTELAREKLVSSDPGSTAGIAEYLKMIESAGSSARRLARDMWDFARATPGTIEPFDVAELADTCSRLVGPTLRVATIEPPSPGTLESATATGDRATWTQALVGVMIEAPSALPAGGSVSWSLRRREDGRAFTLALVAEPNQPGATVMESAPARAWVCGEAIRFVVESLGGAVRPSSGIEGGRTAIEVTVPSEARVARNE